MEKRLLNLEQEVQQIKASQEHVKKLTTSSIVPAGTCFPNSVSSLLITFKILKDCPQFTANMQLSWTILKAWVKRPLFSFISIRFGSSEVQGLPQPNDQVAPQILIILNSACYPLLI